MKAAKTILEEFIAFAFRDPAVAAQMFAPDGIFEIPYLASFAIQPRYQGHDEIAGFFKFVRDLYPGFTFENLVIQLDTPDVVFAEYEFKAVSSVTGRQIHQLFFGCLEVKDAKIRRLREAFNCFEVVRGLTKDVRADPQLSRLVNGDPPSYPSLKWDGGEPKVTRL